MSENRNQEIAIRGTVVPVARINGSLGASSVLGSVDLGREIVPKYADLILRFAHTTDFPAIGDERLIYLDMSTMTMYLWSNSGSYSPISNSDFDPSTFDPGELSSIVVSDGVATFNAGALPGFNI